MDKIIHWVALIAAFTLMFLGLYLRDCSAHQSEYYCHATGNTKGYGIYDRFDNYAVWYANAEHTMCINLIIMHGHVHRTLPYPCGEELIPQICEEINDATTIP